VEMNGRPAAFHIAANEQDQHVAMRVSAAGKSNTLRIRVRNDFGLAYESNLPRLGARSQELRILSETWSASKDQLAVEVSGAAGSEYRLRVWNAGQIQKVEGADLDRTPQRETIGIQIRSSDTEPYPRTKVVFRFSTKQDKPPRGKP
jgi:hypothetical protein